MPTRIATTIDGTVTFFMVRAPKISRLSTSLPSPSVPRRFLLCSKGGLSLLVMSFFLGSAGANKGAKIAMNKIDDRIIMGIQGSRNSLILDKVDESLLGWARTVSAVATAVSSVI